VRAQITTSRILVVEDSASDFAMLKAHLDDFEHLGDARVERAVTLGAALEMLHRTRYDAVLVDLGLPDSDGLATFDRVFGASAAAAVLVMTGLDDALLAEEAVRRGAQDYLVKGDRRQGEVSRAVHYAIRRQQVLDELRRARDEQLAAKDNFLSHISHELRSPLSVVHQFASLLLDGVGGSLLPEQEEFLTVLMRNVRQLNVMIDDLLEVSHAQRDGLSVNCEVVSLPPVLAGSVASFRPLAAIKRVTLNLVSTAVPDVVGDSDRIHEVAGNLIENALKFTPAGGQVTVSASVEGPAVRVSVRDNGRGIAESDLSRIFEQFFQAKQTDTMARRGLGLGLFVCRDLVERQGGEIRAESTLGRGTTMSFTLPLADQAATGPIMRAP
jgi:signal transduction histidine kinase